MAKRLAWTPIEDERLIRVINVNGDCQTKIKWNQLSMQLAKVMPQWRRTGKQCRQRWMSHLRPIVNKLHSPQEIDHELFLTLIRQYGRKWSIIASQIPGTSDSLIKSCFYTMLRKGLQNLNKYNNQFRTKKMYKAYEKNLIEKVLFINDNRRSSDFLVADESAFVLAEEIRDHILACSKPEIKSRADLNHQLEELFQSLSEKIYRFRTLCRYRKCKARKSAGQNSGLTYSFKSESEPRFTRQDSEGDCRSMNQSDVTAGKQIKNFHSRQQQAASQQQRGHQFELPDIGPNQRGLDLRLEDSCQDPEQYILCEDQPENPSINPMLFGLFNQEERANIFMF